MYKRLALNKYIYLLPCFQYMRLTFARPPSPPHTWYRRVSPLPYQKKRKHLKKRLPCSSEFTILDIIALMMGVGMPPRHAAKGTIKLQGLLRFLDY